MLDSYCALGVEGLISKRADAPYYGNPAKRSSRWLKIKCTRRQEFVIVGWLPSERRHGFRSLLLATHKDGELVFAGKVGTGFSNAEMTRLENLMQPLELADAPVSAPRQGYHDAHWITPRLVAEIAYAEITGDGSLRHASYLGQREDKPAEEVVLEVARKLPK